MLPECPHSGEGSSDDDDDRFRCGCTSSVDGFHRSLNCVALCEGREGRRKAAGKPWPPASRVRALKPRKLLATALSGRF